MIIFPDHFSVEYVSGAANRLISAVFSSLPYLLPTVMAGIILLAGAVLACLLSWDGGIRGGSRINLPIEKANRPELSPAPSQRTAVPSLRHRRSLLSPGLETETGPTRRDSRASLGTAYG